MKRRVVVIGLDGATFDLIQPWCEAGYLPTLSRLMSEGAWGPLCSTIPPISAPAWASFMTGQNPGRHGLYDWVTRNGKLVNSTSIRSETLWRTLSRAGKRVVVINVPLTYPPDSLINGVMVSGMLSPPGSLFTYPPEFSDMLRERGYVVDLNDQTYGQEMEPERMGQLASIMLHKRTELVMELVDAEDWDFFVVVFVGPDRLQHQLWQASDVILDHYQQLDATLNRLLNRLDESVMLLVMSDHGFGWMKKRVYLNVWLEEQGFLQREVAEKENLRRWMEERYGTQPGPAASPAHNRYGVFTGEDLRVLVRRLGLHHITRRLPLAWKRRLLSPLPERQYAINWSCTVAYMPTIESQAVNINLKGREPYGVVKPNDYQAVRDKVIAHLKDLIDPETGLPVMDEISRREEVYEGPYLADAPDLLLHFRDECYLAMPDLWPRIVFSKEGISYHRRDGILICWGPEIAPGRSITGASIRDIAPTILHVLGVPIPENCDGRMVTNLFRSNATSSIRPVRYQSPVIPQRSADFSASEAQEIEARLRALGYLE